MFSMELHQIIACDLLNCFGLSILGAAVWMSSKQNFIKDHRSHIRSILRTDGKTGQQLRAQFFHFGFREGRLS